MYLNSQGYKKFSETDNLRFPLILILKFPLSKLGEKFTIKIGIFIVTISPSFDNKISPNFDRENFP